MRSRVNKNQQLYNEINVNAESGVENSNLSSFAQQLNELDSQFETIKTRETTEDIPKRARDTVEQTVGFETYENEYLDDFLEEVKNYNVQKGYRVEGNTQTHILNELRSNPGSSYANYTTPKESVVTEDTQVFTQIVESKPILTPVEEIVTPAQSTQKTPIENPINPSIEETISMAIKDMELYDGEKSINKEEVLQEAMVDGVVMKDLVISSSTREEELLEQTMTLQHKIIEQEEEISTLQTEKDKTGQLLNITIVLLIFTIIVLGVIIVINMMN